VADISLALPPGLYRNGTEFQSQGRWFDASLTRFFEGSIRPVGGWVPHSASAVSGKARALITWKDNGNDAWIAIASETHLYVMTRSGVLHDITPAGFNVPPSGRPDATLAGGYGLGAYGAGAYGTPRLDVVEIQDATMGSLDTWGEDLLFCNDTDQRLYEWVVASGVGVAAAAVANAPTCQAVVVTAEGFVFALGAGGDQRNVAWCDQRNDTLWAPDATNQAGDFDLQTFGRLMCGRRLSGGTGLWTDLDMWVATYIGGTLVYGFDKVGSGCGAVSRQAVAAVDAQCVWMSQNGFWTFNSYVAPLNCDVQDYVFGDLNRDQVSKIFTVHNTDYGEVWWFYPSAAAIEIDRYVIWNYRENSWNVGQLSRLSGTERGVFTNPMMTGPDGIIYEHETGWAYDGAQPYLTSGPLQLGAGDQVFTAQQLIGDEKTQGQVTLSFTGRFFPNGPGMDFGAYSLIPGPPTDVRFTARQIEMTVTGVAAADWRFGDGRLTVNAGGRR
jgi:hypothetical protein